MSSSNEYSRTLQDVAIEWAAEMITEMIRNR
jgi:hypothetical protein